ncbi:Ig-like domain-containing protein [Bacillus sp. Cr_A10]|uniref:leucine-rich repeat domain-containing protein n=1 Tax=Bacillus sp. Cr_A10 TaxID=3033993 RepID=UPI0023DA49A3|nr:Ig-like domain-containing protein [Bacillus sp. Cr_A10]MDF2066561.1 Ig-like domain-containing protein [Bacillus sp. Cr_A10]
MKLTILSIFFALFLLSLHSPVYASDLASNTVIQLEDSILQENLASYVDSCDRQYNENITIDRISTCLEKNNGTLTLGSWYAGDVRTFKGVEKLAGLPIKQLSIQNTHESGRPTDLTPLSKINSLESLQLTGTYANDFSPLGALPNLRELAINSTHNQPLLSISLIENLQKLRLRGNQVTSLAGIERMQQLKTLAINDVSIPDYSELTKAPQLTELSLSFNGSSHFLQSLPNLESLSLFNSIDKTQVIQGDDLKKLTKLKYLRLNRFEVNYDFLNVMPRLEELSISYSLKDTSTLFNAINEPLVHLRNIDLSDNNELTAIEGAEKLSYLFPSIEKINLRGNEITDLSNLVQTDIPYQHLDELDIDGNKIAEINILGEHAKLFPALKTIYAESNYIHSISEMTQLPVLQSLFAEYNLIDVSDEKNPKRFVGYHQFQLRKPKPLEMSIGFVHDGPILSKYSIQDEDWIERINSKNLTIIFSNPEVAELTERGNILAKKQGTTTISYSVKGSNDPYFSHSLLLTVRDKYYKPLDPTIYGEVTLQTNKMTVHAFDEDKVVVSSKGKVIAEVEPSGMLTFTLPSLEGLTELQVWAESKLGIKSDTITVPIYITEKPQMPNIDDFFDHNEYITGKAEPNTTIYVTAERKDGLFRDQSQKVNADGTFKFYTGKLPGGYSLVFFTKNKEGRESDYISSSVRDITPPAVPAFDSVTSDSKEISGKTEANAKVTINKMSRYIGDTFADQNGVFKYSIPAPSPGDIFTAIAEDKHKNKSKEGRIVVTLPIREEIKPRKPVFWKGLELKKGQSGLVTITKRINLWKREGDKLVFERVLKPGEVYRVYRYDSKYGGQYGVGGNLFITNIKGYQKYETPSKAVLTQVK